MNLSTHRLDEAIRVGDGERPDLGEPLGVQGLSHYQNEMLSENASAEVRAKSMTTTP